MITVWRYVWPLPADKAVFPMPRGAEILCAREQGNHLCIWALVDDQAGKQPRHFELCGTGHPAPAGRYVGTGHLYDGSLILHVFEVTT